MTMKEEGRSSGRTGSRRTDSQRRADSESQDKDEQRAVSTTGVYERHDKGQPGSVWERMTMKGE